MSHQRDVHHNCDGILTHGYIGSLKTKFFDGNYPYV